MTNIGNIIRLSDAVSCVDHLGDLTKHPPERWNIISESNAE